MVFIYFIAYKRLATQLVYKVTKGAGFSAYDLYVGSDTLNDNSTTHNILTSTTLSYKSSAANSYDTSQIQQVYIHYIIAIIVFEPPRGPVTIPAYKRKKAHAVHIGIVLCVTQQTHNVLRKSGYDQRTYFTLINVRRTLIVCLLARVGDIGCSRPPLFLKTCPTIYTRLDQTSHKVHCVIFLLETVLFIYWFDGATRT